MSLPSECCSFMLEPWQQIINAYWPHTIEGEQRWKIPAVMNSCGVGCTGHPQILIDGWCGNNVTIHCGDFPVSVWKGDPDHQPSQKAQEEGDSFHCCVHIPSFLFVSNQCQLSGETNALYKCWFPRFFFLSKRVDLLGQRVLVCEPDSQQSLSYEAPQTTNQWLIPNHPLMISSIIPNYLTFWKVPSVYPTPGTTESNLHTCWLTSIDSKPFVTSWRLLWTPSMRPKCLMGLKSRLGSFPGRLLCPRDDGNARGAEGVGVTDDLRCHPNR